MKTLCGAGDALRLAVRQGLMKRFERSAREIAGKPYGV